MPCTTGEYLDVRRLDASAGEPAWTGLEVTARPHDNGVNAVLFLSGDGDGVSSSFFGLATLGEVGALTTVFDIVECEGATPPPTTGHWR